MPGIFDPTLAWTIRAHPFSLHWAAQDLVDVSATRGFVVPLETISISEVGANGRSSMTFTVQDAKRALALPALGRVQLNDHLAGGGVGEVSFAGFVQGRRTIPWPVTGYAIQTTCTDYSYLLDTTVVPALSHKAGASDKTLIQSVVGYAMRGPQVYTHTSLCTSTNASMPAMDFSHMTLRAAIESIQAAAGEQRHYYVDFLGRLHYFLGPTESGMGNAPFVITDNPTAGQRATTDLAVEYDDSQIANCVYIFGGSAKGSGWEKDEASIKLYGVREAFFSSPTCKTAAHRFNVGRHFLGLHKDPIVRGSFGETNADTGWRVGQTVTVTDSRLGISSATYPVTQIDTTFLTGTGQRHRMIHFGDLPASGRRRPHVTPALSAGPPPSTIIAPTRTSGPVGFLANRAIN